MHSLRSLLVALVALSGLACGEDDRITGGWAGYWNDDVGEGQILAVLEKRDEGAILYGGIGFFGGWPAQGTPCVVGGELNLSKRPEPGTYRGTFEDESGKVSLWLVAHGGEQLTGVAEDLEGATCLSPRRVSFTLSLVPPTSSPAPVQAAY